MTNEKAIELLKIAVPQDESLDEDGLFIEAVGMAIEALGKSPTALDHIHNVVAENERKRGYEQAKEEYDHKLTVIKGRFKDHYYNKGYEQGKKDAIKWIPIKIRPLTDDEKEYHPEWCHVFDCAMPDDGQEILITYKRRNGKAVCEDTFFDDGDCCYLDSGLELNDEVLAWAEKPQPWEGEQNGKVD